MQNGNAVFGGPKGEVKISVHEDITVQQKDGKIFIISKNPQKNTKAMLGTTYSLFKNAVKGVEEGFEKKLEIEGIGYKAQLEGETLSLSLGFSHPIKIKSQKGIYFKVEKNIITVSGADKDAVGRTAAQIRQKKPPEPYKGKGIRYSGEIVRRKAGKKAVSAA